MADTETELKPMFTLSLATVRRMLEDNVPAPYYASLRVEREHVLYRWTEEGNAVKQWRSWTTVYISIYGDDYSRTINAHTAEDAFLIAITEFKRFWARKQRGTPPTKG